MKQHKTHSNKLGTTVENSVFEYDDNIIIVCLGDVWFPCLQRKEVRGQTRRFQRLLYGWKNPKVCAKIDKTRAVKVARSYARGSQSLHADPKTHLLPVSYALYLGVLQGSESDKRFLDRMQQRE